MAKKGNRVQVILECTEHKESGLPVMYIFGTAKGNDVHAWFAYCRSNR